jgi:hypothetical protein
MFVSENVAALFKKGKLSLVPTEDGYKREAEATLVIEPFTPRLARELGDDITEHLFTDDDEIRDELELIDLRVTVGPQNVVARRHEELEPVAILSPCVIKDVSVKRCSKKDEADWLACSFVLVFGLEDKEARAFVLDEFGKRLRWTFEAMQRDLLSEARLHDAIATLADPDGKGETTVSVKGPGDTEFTQLDADTAKRHRAAAKNLRQQARTH